MINLTVWVGKYHLCNENEFPIKADNTINFYYNICTVLDKANPLTVFSEQGNAMMNPQPLITMNYTKWNVFQNYKKQLKVLHNLMRFNFLPLLQIPT